MYDSEDTEGFDPDVPAAMGGMTYAERPRMTVMAGV